MALTVSTVLGAMSTSPGNFFTLSIGSMIFGAALMGLQNLRTVGKLVLFFGAQSFMNIYIGWVMRSSVLLPKGTYIQATNYTLQADLTGCPAGFALTALQQLVSFALFGGVFAALYFTPWRYTPRPLSGRFELLCILISGIVFALNIALNNLSLAYVSVAVNLVIRSSLPLTTYVTQQGLAVLGLYPWKPVKWFEVFLMSFGVGCACVFTVVLGEGDSRGSSQMALGVGICVVSVFFASLNMALTGVLGETKLNVYDAVAYMALPATLALVPLALFWENPLPGEWSKVVGQDKMTDVQVFMTVWSLSKGTVAWLLLSGAFSFAYNVVHFEVIHTLDPTAACVGGNCNKAAVILLTLLVPSLRARPLPGQPYLSWMWGSVSLNVAAFTWYNILQIQARQAAAKEAQKQHEEEKARDLELFQSLAATAPEASDTEEDQEESKGFLASLAGRAGWSTCKC